VAWMLVTTRTRLTVLADAGTPSQAQRSERRWPEPGGLRPEPALHIRW
jgi:hypothetical protein